MTDENNKIERAPAEDNPWYKFFMVSTELDQGDRNEGPYGIKPYGWHWFWGIYFLHQKMPKFPSFNLTEIQKRLPDEHWLKNATDDGEKITYQSDGSIPDHICQGDAMVALYKILQEHNITEAPEEINFSNLDFKEHLNLSNVIFLIRTSFRDSNFHKSANFINARFFDIVYFDRTVFIGNDYFFHKGSIFSYTNFQGAEFYKWVSFGGAQLTEVLGFREVKFFQGASFNDAIFLEGARFEKAEFIHSGASFKKTKFSNVASFAEAIFSKGAFFEGAEFPKSPYYVDFSGANFETGGFFNDAKFFGLAIFYNTKFGGRAVFDGVKFSAEASFRDTNFLNHINFKNAIFEIHTPVFYGAKLTGDITWRNATWPSMNIKTDPDLIDQNQSAYENLAYHMKAAEKYHDEHFFFRQEMRCRRWFGKNRFIRFPYVAYEWLADYGYGFGKAIIAWASHIVIGAVIIFGLRYFNCFKDFTYDFGCSLGISLSNSHAFFFNGDRLKDCYDTFETLPWFNFIWGLQTITGTLLIFLVLLTLRVRFRLK